METDAAREEAVLEKLTSPSEGEVEMKEETVQRSRVGSTKVKEQNRNYYSKNSEKLKAAANSRYAENPDVWRSRNLKELGWTLEMAETTDREQGGRCAICRKIPFGRSDKRLCADHKHTTPPEPRALLCTNCNTAIGLLMDNPELCEAAAEYLRAWGE